MLRTVLMVLGLWFVIALVVALFLGRVFQLGRLVVVTAACAAAPSVVAAQERTLAPVPAWPAYSVMVAGNVADIWTTGQAFQRGAHEGNHLTSTNRIGPLSLSKASMVVGLTLTMRLLETHGHPRIAKVIGFLDGGVTAAAAVHNHGVAR